MIPAVKWRLYHQESFEDPSKLGKAWLVCFEGPHKLSVDELLELSAVATAFECDCDWDGCRDSDGDSTVKFLRLRSLASREHAEAVLVLPAAYADTFQTALLCRLQ